MNDAITGTARVADGHLAYRQWRAAHRADVPLILLHGFTGSSCSWAPLAARWSTGREVVAFDLPGHGATDLGTVRSACDMATFATAFDEALVALSIERFDLLGYSLGGRTALYLAVASERASRQLRRLVLESASAGLATDAERASRRREDEALIHLLLEEGIEPFVERWERTPVLAGQSELPTSERNRLRAQRLACAPSGLAASLAGMGTGAQPWLGEDATSLACPTLCVAGADDTKFATLAKCLARVIPDCSVALLPDCGHSPHLENPESYFTVVDAFLTGGDGRESILNAS